MSKSKIEWTEHSWNFLVGCSIVSPGCTNCYAMKMAARIEAMAKTQPEHHHVQGSHYVGTTKKVNGNAVWTGKVAQAPEHILFAPLHRVKPTTYFVNSMSDLFHETVPDEWIDRGFSVMERTPQHTYQILTKRPDRMQAYMERRERPLPNVWCGISVERQREADERIPILRKVKAAIRFISFEPLLGRVDTDLSGVDWAIIGGESGPYFRPMEPEWAQSLLDQCSTAGVAPFMKQMAGKKPIPTDLMIREYPTRSHLAA